MDNTSPDSENSSPLPFVADSTPLRVAGRDLWQRLHEELTGRGNDTAAPVRYATHLALLLVVIGVLLVGRMQMPQWNIEPVSLLPAPTASPTADPEIRTSLARGGTSLAAVFSLSRAAVPFTTIPDRPRLDILTYKVQAGDTVFSIADQFGIQPSTIMWANRDLELNPDMLRIGDELVILPVDGVYHKVKKGDTVVSIAKKYKVQPADIVAYAWNHLDDENQTLQVGTHLIVPGGEKPYVPRTVSIYNGPIPKSARKGTGTFVWPVSGKITQGYWAHHRAIDIGSWVGSPVVASDSGYVVYAGWDNSGYGNLIILDHGNGYRTYYAHLSKMLVRQGESVGQGQRIGSVGSTGNSTGPHLHFEIRWHNVQRNPFGFLR
jgi:murein DD-endopeptidase MepM/ murein hydrolase activator NlpD